MSKSKANKYGLFTTGDLEEITQVSARKLRWWDKQGLLKPGGLPERKRWQTRRYTLQDIVCVLVIKALRDRGVSLQRIRETVLRISVIGIEMPLAKFRAACLSNSVILKMDGKYIDPISGQMAFENALETIRPHIKRRSFATTKRDVELSNIHYGEKVAHS
jgi:hypothetical protein